MILAQKGFQRSITFGRGLDDQGNLPIFLDCILPAVIERQGDNTLTQAASPASTNSCARRPAISASGRVVRTRRSAGVEDTRTDYDDAGCGGCGMAGGDYSRRHSSPGNGGHLPDRPRIGWGWTLLWLIAALWPA